MATFLKMFSEFIRYPLATAPESVQYPNGLWQESNGNLLANSQRNLHPSDKTLAIDRGMPLPQVNGQSVYML